MAELIFKGTPQLKTERLILRKITPQDDRDIFEYASDDQVSRYLTWDTHKTLEDTRWFIQFTLGRYQQDEAGDWGIVWRESGKLIGTAGFVWYDMNNRRAEMGYVLSRLFWGQGIMAEAVRRILQFAFEEMGLNRIECCHFLPNEKSGRVMQKAGMTFEGVARERVFAKGKYWDVKQYAILRSDKLEN
jgi:Acetyltransferases, including N-acetylases of ribosomal proteins